VGKDIARALIHVFSSRRCFRPSATDRLMIGADGGIFDEGMFGIYQRAHAEAA
jgi:hypothetical protein